MATSRNTIRGHRAIAVIETHFVYMRYHILRSELRKQRAKRKNLDYTMLQNISYPNICVTYVSPNLVQIAPPNFSARARAQEDARDFHAHGTAGQLRINCQVQDQDPCQKEALAGVT